MANAENLEIKVDVVGIDVPLMIVVGEGGKTEVYRHGRKVPLVRSIKFSAAVDEMTTVTIEEYPQ